MAEIKFLERKELDIAMSASLEKQPDFNLRNIPLKYVCISPSEIYPVVNDELQLISDKIIFKFSPNIGSLGTLNVEIDRNSIKKIEYSNLKNIFRITIQSDTYSKYFQPKIGKDDLFTDSIWLSLKVLNLDSFTATVDYIRTNFLSSFLVKTMPHDLYVRFKLSLKSFSPSRSSATKTLISDLELSSKLVDIQISDKNQMTKPRRKLKRNFDMPISIKIRRKREKLSPLRKLVYTPSPTHSIEIIESDLLCLTPKKYLNDNIINWYLTCIYHEILTEYQRKASYFFNVFFYTKLIGTEKQETDSPDTKHSRVAKWTKKIDIFSKDFIVIPVIVNKHWFLVIVCFPWMAGVINYAELFNGQDKESVEIPENKSEFATSIREKRIHEIKTVQKVDPMPCILVFDSLDNENRSVEVNNIRNYLKSEWDKKRKSQDGPLIFDKTTCRGYSPLVRKQNNGTDCGLYLLEYVESFFRVSIYGFGQKSRFAMYIDIANTFEITVAWLRISC